MGTDIHCWVEKHFGGAWHLVMPCEGDAGYRAENDADLDRWGYSALEKKLRHADWDIGRNYDLFAILADVRNGYGVAGIDTGEGFRPILAERRGWPESTCDELKHHDIEHSPSWLRLAEMLDYDWSQKTLKRGVLYLPAYVEFRELRPLHGPDEYCGGAWGPNVETVSPEEADRLLASGERTAKGWTKESWSWRAPKGHPETMVTVEWGTTYSYASGDFYSKHLPSLKKIAEREGVTPWNLRLVFYFDS